MIIAENPYQLFSPIHLAWLYRRREKSFDVTAGDLDSIERNQPEAINDPLFAECRALAKAGKLYRRRGRKPVSPENGLLCFARFWILDEMEAIHARRRAGLEQRARSDFEPCYQAAEIVARRMRLPYSGRWLVKKISKAGVR